MNPPSTENEPIGLRIWTEFTRLRANHSESLRHFGEVHVDDILYAGDGGTFACHVKERVKKGKWSLYRLILDDLGTVIAFRKGSEPVQWEFSGGIIIDTAVGTILPASTLEDIEGLGDSDELTDAIDDAVFGGDGSEAVIETPNGLEFAVFQLGGDGTYNVFKGMDKGNKTCALAIVMWDRDYTKESATEHSGARHPPR